MAAGGALPVRRLLRELIRGKTLDGARQHDARHEEETRALLLRSES